MFGVCTGLKLLLQVEFFGQASTNRFPMIWLIVSCFLSALMIRTFSKSKQKFMNKKSGEDKQFITPHT